MLNTLHIRVQVLVSFPYAPILTAMLIGVIHHYERKLGLKNLTQVKEQKCWQGNTVTV